MPCGKPYLHFISTTKQVGDEGMSLEALADAIQVDPSDIVRTLFMKGIMLSLNQVRSRARGFNNSSKESRF